MLTLPVGLILPEGEASSSFSKTIYFQSNQGSVPPRTVTVSRKNSTSYALNLTIQLLLGEVVTFYATWTAEGKIAGNYNIRVLAFSDDSDVDPLFRSCQDVCEVQILGDVPIINEPIISPVYYPSGFSPQEMYTYPWQNVEVRCNVTCLIGVKNVTLWYLSSEVWNKAIMVRSSGDEWIGIAPGQPEGKQIILCVEAFSSTEKSSKTREYALTVADFQLLELRTNVVKVTTVATIIVGCMVIFALKRRKMTET